MNSDSACAVAENDLKPAMNHRRRLLSVILFCLKHKEFVVKSVKLLLLPVLTGLIGCGGGPSDLPNLGAVSGTVTLAGAPLQDAVVTFTPVKGGRPSTGRTDPQGEYTLIYTSQHGGAVVGAHSVRLALADTGSDEAYESGEGEAAPGDNESDDYDSGLPANATDGSLRYDVVSGANTIDIEL